MPTVISEDDFQSKFRPVLGPDGSEMREFEEVQSTAKEYVWTVVETGEDEILYAMAGFHVVNRVGYVITEEPWTDPDSQAAYCTGPDVD